MVFPLLFQSERWVHISTQDNRMEKSKRFWWFQLFAYKVVNDEILGGLRTRQLPKVVVYTDVLQTTGKIKQKVISYYFIRLDYFQYSS